jgi:tetratricopeptide (TPR) repeat protein
LIRTRNRRVGPTAADLLRDAIRIDPGYAPAWASLAEATQMQGALGDREAFVAAVRKARDYARRSVSLAPELAEAHRALGRTFGYGDPEGLAHVRRAAELDPNNADTLIEMGSALAATGEFERQLATYRRAHEFDPLWYRTTGITSIALAEIGERAEAEALGRRGLPDKKANLQILLGRIAWTFADYSEAARRWAIVARSNSPRWPIRRSGPFSMRSTRLAWGLEHWSMFRRSLRVVQIGAHGLMRHLLRPSGSSAIVIRSPPESIVSTISWPRS